MGEARRRKLVGNTEPNPNWRRPMSKEEIREVVQKAVSSTLPAIVAMSQDMIRKR